MEDDNTHSEQDAHEFGAVNTLLLVAMLALCIFCGYLIHKHKLYYVPESTAAVCVGLVVGLIMRILSVSEAEMHFLSLEPEIFFFIILPPIIFEAGYSLRKKHFFENFWTIILFAVLGTVVSAFVIGYLTYAAGLVGAVTIDTSSPMQALVFGSLLSAVDPVATLSILGNPELNCDPLLYSLVFGESVLNDAVAITLFNTFRDFYSAGKDFTAETFLDITLNFTGVSLGSILVGCGMGLACAYLFKHTNIKQEPKHEVSLLLLFSYGAYALPEVFELSGIMSLFFCGVVLSHYNTYNLSPASKITAENLFKSMASLSEFVIFLYMGMGMFTNHFHPWNFGFIILTIIFCLVSRALNIFPFSMLANLGRHKKITLASQIVMWFAGLRGAIAFVLARNMPGEHVGVYTTTTLAIVLFTTLVCGGLTEPLLDKVGAKQARPYSELSDESELERELVQHRGHPCEKTGIHGFWRRIDNSYMKPLFGGSSGNNNSSNNINVNGSGDNNIYGNRNCNDSPRNSPYASELVSRRNVELASPDSASCRLYQA